MLDFSDRRPGKCGKDVRKLYNCVMLWGFQLFCHGRLNVPLITWVLCSYVRIEPFSLEQKQRSNSSLLVIPLTVSILYMHHTLPRFRINYYFYLEGIARIFLSLRSLPGRRTILLCCYSTFQTQVYKQSCVSSFGLDKSCALLGAKIYLVVLKLTHES